MKNWYKEATKFTKGKLKAKIFTMRNKYKNKPLYNTVCYNMVLDITWFEDGPQKCIDDIEKWP